MGGFECLGCSPPTSAAFQDWQYDHQQSTMTLYVFNITNPAEVLKGAPVNVSQVRGSVTRAVFHGGGVGKKCAVPRLAVAPLAAPSLLEP